ncbi:MULTISPECIES: aconitase family protein [Cupriavidus]|uniref:aconitase family protein n=1 Tax=Cupriavidus TaxID=106589 RepID=UPI00035E86EC|nr:MULTISPECIES: aconitase family protein [Cupriavidus]
MSRPSLTVAEKILARAAGLGAVRAGDVVWAVPDLIVAHDLNYHRHRKMLDGLGYANLAAPGKVFVTIDHTTNSAAPGHLEAHAFMRGDARAQGVGWFLDTGRHGISHNAPLDFGIVRPGMLVVAADTRAPALGCAGALGVALGLSVTLALATGKVWLRVPETIRVRLSGPVRAGVMSRDVGQWVAAAIGAERGDYRCIEFHGSYVDALGEDERHTLCNAMVDIGVKAAVCPATDAHGVRWASDPGARFAEDIAFDVSGLDLQVCLPPDPQHTVPLARAAGVPITSAFIGSCIGGKMEDLRAAAAVLAGRRVHAGVRLTVIAATQAIYQQAMREGLLAILSAAGAEISAGICGPCYGTYAPLGDNDVSICTATRNDHGRLGSERAPVYLANAAVVAASAVMGRIAAPAELTREAA